MALGQQHGAPAVAFLPALVQAAERVFAEGTDMSTEAFAALMDAVVRIFDHTGKVLGVAKGELVSKTQSLHVAAPDFPRLSKLVEHDKAMGRATVKDSCTRNLHRLLYVLKFMRVMLAQLISSPTVTVREAITKAYEQSLAQVHPYVVRTAVWASLYLLPTREHFLKEIGETEASAAKWAREFLECSKDMEQHVLKLYEGIRMPTATASSQILSVIWGKAAAPCDSTGPETSKDSNTSNAARTPSATQVAAASS